MFLCNERIGVYSLVHRKHFAMKAKRLLLDKLWLFSPPFQPACSGLNTSEHTLVCKNINQERSDGMFNSKVGSSKCLVRRLAGSVSALQHSVNRQKHNDTAASFIRGFRLHRRPSETIRDNQKISIVYKKGSLATNISQQTRKLQQGGEKKKVDISFSFPSASPSVMSQSHSAHWPRSSSPSWYLSGFSPFGF